MRIFEELESEVRGYVRAFPAVFDTAKGPFLYDEQGNRYIDFFAGAGTLNYGHNNPVISDALIEYLQRDGIVHALDKATVAKRDFMEKLQNTVLQPRGLEYKIQFTGPPAPGTSTPSAACWPIGTGPTTTPCGVWPASSRCSSSPSTRPRN
jgi:diaminobutyrate-2-oxoglutarate transaminase